MFGHKGAVVTTVNNNDNVHCVWQCHSHAPASQAIGCDGVLDNGTVKAVVQRAAYTSKWTCTPQTQCVCSVYSTQGPKAVKQPALQRGFLGRAGSRGSQGASSRSALKASSRPLDELAQLATAPASQQPDHVARVGCDLHAQSASGAAEHASGAAGLQRLRIVPAASEAEVAASQMMS